MANASAPSYCFPRRPVRLGLAGPAGALSVAPRPHVPSLSVKTATGARVSILNDTVGEEVAAPEYRRSSSMPDLVLAPGPSAVGSAWMRSSPAGFSAGHQGFLPSLSALVTAAEMASSSPSPPVTPMSGQSSPMTEYAGGYHGHMAAPAGTKTMAKRRYRCSFDSCGKAFTTSGHLARHQRIHTGEKNFACQFPGCSSRFSRQDNMMQHYRTHLSPKSRRLTSPQKSAFADDFCSDVHPQPAPASASAPAMHFHPYMVHQGHYARPVPALQHMGPAAAHMSLPPNYHAGVAKLPSAPRLPPHPAFHRIPAQHPASGPAVYY
ncbi:transcriptional repressor [Coemansia thaxteri]|uniref:Transcriptional repressor n=1 Tax=Coemansia thaxteri TaxID=2663907 RepID=A0A9W8BJM4_9FUNG|nr:transcriptional repressor [Coemansia thaxteri]KAJ2005577.1 transcriptional repressor [Coemansia thaxteri]KAJ2471615.1 transcriptional repressor [Coemansia sp. RSA 2322]KAJ2483162.1 transcriptional repressor [Coemansia sp. RSA 2320]